MDLRFKKLFENIFLTQRNAKGRNFHVNMRKMNLLWMFAAMAAMWVSCGTPETEQSGRPGILMIFRAMPVLVPDTVFSAHQFRTRLSLKFVCLFYVTGAEG